MGLLEISPAGLDTTPVVESVCEVSDGACVLRLLVLGVEVVVFIDCYCAEDRVEFTC